VSRAWAPGACLLALLAAPTVVACKRRQEDALAAPIARVRCAAAETTRLSRSASLRGTVAAAPDRDAVVSPQVSGRLLRVLVREGDPVKQGALLAEVESQPLRDALRQAQALLAQAKAAREAAAAAATREEHLYERGINARQTFEAAHAALGQSSAAVAFAGAQVDVARQNVSRSLVRAPIAGVVVRLLRRVGEVVDGTPATPVMEIADPASLELAASAPASDLVLLAVGQESSITFDALPGHSFAAAVRSVSPSVDTTTGVGSVRLAILGKQEIRPPLGLLGNASVTLGAPRDAVVVPASAVRNAGGSRTEVVLCEGGKARPLLIEVGERREERVEIVRGLEAGARVAIEGLTGLEDGAAIEELP
jgi:RND family efflux transporter MFP subunit